MGCFDEATVKLDDESRVELADDGQGTKALVPRVPGLVDEREN